MKAQNVQSEPKIVHRDEEFYLGIRTVSPFRGMFAAADALKKELSRGVSELRLDDAGPYLLRYHVIDMEGMMDIEVGVKVGMPVEGTDRIRPGVLPSGTYATLIYRGNGRSGHRALIGWIRAQALAADVVETAEGDRFGCRYEAYLTDPRVEPRKLLWDIELSIRLRD